MRIFRHFWQDDRRLRRSFLLGERSLRAYLAGGNVRFLKDAEFNFSGIGPEFKQYENARFYLGITKAQLRKSTESIEILNDLKKSLSGDRKSDSNLGFANRIALQLAYAHIKTYTETGYQSAKQILDDLLSSPLTSKSKELFLQAESLQSFLYSVMAGRSSIEASRPDFARNALQIGDTVLKDPQSSPGVRFEALNALGITWMRIAQKAWEGFGDRENNWTKSQSYFDQALRILPNSVRVLQNMATLRFTKAEQVPSDRSKLLDEAKQLVTRSLEINDQDQFPFYRLAQIAVQQGDKESALHFIREGKTRPGAVKDREWAEVESGAAAIPPVQQ